MTSDSSFYFLNSQSVSIHLYCSICQDVFNEPQRAPCGHSFCKNCIGQWLRQSKTCPEDRKPLAPKQLHYDFILANIIGDQIVACPFRGKGCEFIDKLEKISSHSKACTFNPDNLPDFMKEDGGGNTSITSVDENRDPDQLPTPAKPSLRMRLFCDEKKRDALRSLLDNTNKSASGASSNNTGGRSFGNVWLSKDETVS